MRITLRLAAAVAALGWTTAAAHGQATRADYARADGLYWATYGAVRHPRVVPHWTADGGAFWYATVGDDDWNWQWWWVDAEAGTRRLAFDPTRLATALYDAHLLGYQPVGLPVEDLDVGPRPGTLRVAVAGRWMTVDLNTYALSDVVPLRDVAAAVPHPLARVDAGARTDFLKQDEDVARLVIVNRTGGPVKVETVSSTGTRHPRADDVGGDCDRVLNVWAGQVLVASDKAGRTLGYWRADRDGGMLVLDPSPTTAPATGPAPRPSFWAALGRALRARRAASQPASRPTDGPTTSPTTEPITTAIQATTQAVTRPTTGPTTGPVSTAFDPAQPGVSPDGRWTAFVRDHNVWLRDGSGAVDQLTRDGTAGDGYDAVRQLYWSPDARAVVAMRYTDGARPQLTEVQSSPPDQLQPRVERELYRTPGDRIGHLWPHLFDVARRREVPITGCDAPDPEFVAGPDWGGDPARFTFAYDRRGHQLARTFMVETATGVGRTIVDEHSDTFIDHRLRLNWYDAATHQSLWMSERDGRNHLYRYDTATGRLLNAVTPGDLVVQAWDDKLDQVDVEDNGVFFRAAGLHPGEDPYDVHFCRCQLDGTGLLDLTPGPGTHTVQDSPHGRFYLDTCSRVDRPPTVELRRYDDGGLVCPLERADWTRLLLSGWQPPEPFTAKGRDGKTDICGVIYRPTHFDPGRKYPVVEDIYAGPQKQSVPHAFARWRYPMGVAELGFIVVQIDGMGTPGRTKAFHDLCWHNWADCGLDDRAAWIRAAAAKHPEMDLSGGVGVYGGSFGGYAAVRALEARPDLYTVAVAQDGCHDPRLYAQWYGEQYLGWPLGPWYAEQASAAHVDRIAAGASLLLMMDETDHNVAPSATMQVVNALIHADKDFSFLEIPNGDHMGGGAYADRRREDFLVRHLMGVEPRVK